MLVLQRNVFIAILVNCIAVEVEPVLAEITGEINSISLIDLVSDIQVNIIKACLTVFILVR